MGFDLDYAEPWLESAPNVAEPIVGMPAAWDIAIGGHAYKVDTEFKPYLRDAFRHRTNPGQRQGIDVTNVQGEGTVNPEGLWRRSVVDWSLGAGQLFLDRKDSAANRFFQSKGVDPFTTKWQTTLLPDTQQIAEVSGSVQAVGVGVYAYILDIEAQTLEFSETPEVSSSWTAVTGLPTSMTNLATDGYNIWVAANEDGVYTTTAGSTSSSQYVTGPCGLVWWAADRLLVGSGPAFYNILATGPVGQGSQLLLEHPNPSWSWNCVGEGSGEIYIGGYVGTDPNHTSSSGVYRTTIESTGTALQVPVLSLPLAGGEAVTALYGYVNLVGVGTNLGFRLCRTISAYDPTGNAGDLESGPLVPNLLQPVTSPVYGIVGNNRFIMFSATNYDDQSTGIWRCDISQFIDTLAPAYASHLMCSAQGTVSWLDWFAPYDTPLISVNGVGVFIAAPDFVDEGYVDSGLLVWDIEDDKIVLAGDIHVAQPLQGSVAMSIAADQRQLAEVGSQSENQPNISPFDIEPIRGQCFETRLTLQSDDGNGNTPILFRWTNKALPCVVAGTSYSVVLDLFSQIEQRGADVYQNAYDEYMYLRNLRENQTIVTYQEGPFSAQVTVDEIDWLPFSLRESPDSAGGFNSIATVYLKDWSARG